MTVRGIEGINMTQQPELTADEIYNRIAEQFNIGQSQRNGKKALIIFKFENVSFSDNYTFRERKFPDLSHLLKNIFEIIKVTNRVSRVILSFKNCSIKSFVIEELNQKSLKIRFKNCEIKNLEFLRLNERSNRLSLIDSKVHICTFKNYKIVVENSVKAEIFCKNTVFSHSLDCRNVTFSNSVLFLQCEFGGSGNYRSINFSNTVFNSWVSFGGSTFNHAPLFFGANLHPETNFKDCNFKDTFSKDACSTYRKLKQFMMQKESDHEAQMFHALELESKYNTPEMLPKGWKIFSSPNGIETIFSFCLKQLTDYGRNLWLPLIWLLFFLFFFLRLYFLFGGLDCGSTVSIQGWIKSVCEGGYINLFYAVKNTFGPFGLVFTDSGLIIPNSVAVKALGFIHMLLNSVIWFIWILQIRRRFKL